VPLSRRLSAHRRLLVGPSCSRYGIPASLTVGLPTLGSTATGFLRCTRMRPDRGGRLLDPGAPRQEGNVSACIRRFPAASPTPPPKQCLVVADMSDRAFSL
jgi:hypothetical protein